MSGDDTHRPVHGIAAGDPYIALPPTAVDASATGPTRLIIAWPGFDPPRTGRALAAAMPMTGVPVWRVYLDLPRESPGGLESGAILRTEAIEAYGEAVEEAVRRLPAALADLRQSLGLPDGPVALAGFSAGGAAALLAAARDVVPVTALALVTPVVAPSRAAREVEKRSGLDRSWTDDARELADRLDLRGVAAGLAGRNIATLLIGGSSDRVVPARDITALRDELRRHGAGPVESTAFRMGHALAAEPGTEAHPPITEAVRVDGVLTEWFRERLASPAPPAIGERAASPAKASTEPETPEPESEAAAESSPADAEHGTRTEATAENEAAADAQTPGNAEAASTPPVEAGLGDHTDAADTGSTTRLDLPVVPENPAALQPPPSDAEHGAGKAGTDTDAASQGAEQSRSPAAGGGHGAWSLEAGGAPPEAPKTPEPRGAGAGR